MNQVKHLILRKDFIAEARAALNLAHPDIKRNWLSVWVTVDHADVHLGFPELPQGRREKHVHAVILRLSKIVWGDKVQRGASLRCPCRKLGDAVRI